METDFDVIIVGGRVAGSHLGARLGKAGFRVLLLERGTFPSLPAVSSPIIYAPTMQLLDEIGADEADYARNTPKLYHMITITRQLNGKLPIPDYEGRNYAYAIDRARFDASIWETAVHTENVTGWQQFAVTDLLMDGDTVMGIIGKDVDGNEKTITAKVVIGADGRYSAVARKVGASASDPFEDYPTSIYYAYWKNVALHEGEPTAAAYEGGEGAYGYLMMDSADGETVIAVEGRSDALEPDAGDIEGFYLRLLQDNPLVWDRMQSAERVTSVRGMRKIGNHYRQAGGKGWALVGDAYHAKDPLDGQGIYNAVVTGKALAIALKKWRRGELTWEEAIAYYDEVARIKTYPMYKSLQTRVRTSFYENVLPIPPEFQQTLARWLLEDEHFSDLMGKMLTRQMPADMVTLMTPATMVGAMVRGSIRDFRKRVESRLFG